MNLLSLLSGSNLAGSDSPGREKHWLAPCRHTRGQGSLPDGLVGDDNLSPLLLGELLGSSVELPGDNVNGLVALTLLLKYISLAPT